MSTHLQRSLCVTSPTNPVSCGYLSPVSSSAPSWPGHLRVERPSGRLRPPTAPDQLPFPLFFWVRKTRHLLHCTTWAHSRQRGGARPAASLAPDSKLCCVRGSSMDPSPHVPSLQLTSIIKQRRVLRYRSGLLSSGNVSQPTNELQGRKAMPLVQTSTL